MMISFTQQNESSRSIPRLMPQAYFVLKWPSDKIVLVQGFVVRYSHTLNKDKPITIYTSRGRNFVTSLSLVLVYNMFVYNIFDSLYINRALCMF